MQVTRQRPIRQSLVASTLTALLVAALSLVAPPGATAADSDIQVLSIQEFGSGSDREIVGEVRNAGTSPIGTVRVDFSFQSADNRVLSTDFTFARVDRLAPGERSPFSLSFTPVEGYDHYSYVVSDGSDSFRALNHNFTVTVSNQFNDGLFEHIVGSVRNDNTTTASFVSVVGTAYSAGTAVDDAEVFINNNSKELAPGTSATFELIFFGRRTFDSTALLAQSSSDPSSSSTPSPASSPTSSPTASPSSSPTGSPTANEVPSLTVVPFVVKFGQTANVTIEGTPGATVDLFIRKFGGSFIKIRDGLVLDSAGRITVPTRPDQNLRFQAFDRTVEQGSSVGGTSGLMTVEKYISINVQRVSASRYTFTGSINPSHPGASVSLFRNGALLRSGIPVNSSRVYSFTTNLAAGTYNFQVRTGTTGYNNASGSPTRSVRIF